MSPAVKQRLTILPRPIKRADECDVLREQLDYLMDCGAEHSHCRCSECRRFQRVRSILLEIFREPRTPRVQEMPGLSKAA